MLDRYLNEDNFVSSRRDFAVVGAAAAIVVVLVGLAFGLAAAAPPPPPAAAAPPGSPGEALPWADALVSVEDWARPGYWQAVEVLKKTPVIDG